MSHSEAIRNETAELTSLDYEARLARGIASYEDWRNPVLPETEAEYALCMARRSVLSSAEGRLWNGDDAQKRTGKAIDEVVRQYDKCVRAFNALLELGDGPDRAIARYMVCGRTFTNLEDHVCWMEARDRGLLRKRKVQGSDGEYAFYVVGLSYKVGDNTFTCDAKGREHRQYVGTIGRQAITTDRPMPFTGDVLQQFAEMTPHLDDSWYETYVGNAKGAVRPIAMSRKELDEVFGLLNASRHLAAPQFDDTKPTDACLNAAIQGGTAANPPVNGDLFKAELLAA